MSSGEDDYEAEGAARLHSWIDRVEQFWEVDLGEAERGALVAAAVRGETARVIAGETAVAGEGWEAVVQRLRGLARAAAVAERLRELLRVVVIGRDDAGTGSGCAVSPHPPTDHNLLPRDPSDERLRVDSCAACRCGWVRWRRELRWV